MSYSMNVTALSANILILEPKIFCTGHSHFPHFRNINPSNRKSAYATMYYIRNIKILHNLSLLNFTSRKHKYCNVVYERFLVYPRMPVTRNYRLKAS